MTFTSTEFRSSVNHAAWVNGDFPDRVSQIGKMRFLATDVMKRVGYMVQEDKKVLEVTLATKLQSALRSEVRSLVHFFDNTDNYYLPNTDFGIVRASSTHGSQSVDATPEMNTQVKDIVNGVVTTDTTRNIRYWHSDGERDDIDYDYYNYCIAELPPQMYDQIKKGPYITGQADVILIPVTIDTKKGDKERMWAVYNPKTTDGFKGAPDDKDPRRITDFMNSANFVGLVRKFKHDNPELARAQAKNK